MRRVKGIASRASQGHSLVISMDSDGARPARMDDQAWSTCDFFMPVSMSAAGRSPRRARHRDPSGLEILARLSGQHTVNSGSSAENLSGLEASTGKHSWRKRYDHPPSHRRRLCIELSFLTYRCGEVPDLHRFPFLVWAQSTDTGSVFTIEAEIAGGQFETGISIDLPCPESGSWIFLDKNPA